MEVFYHYCTGKLGIAFVALSVTTLQSWTARAGEADASGLYVAGLKAMSDGDSTLAVADFSKAIALTPNDARFYRERACCYMKSHPPMPEKAIVSPSLTFRAPSS
jgi:Flp pilus assembly protein TadD